MYIHKIPTLRCWLAILLVGSFFLKSHPCFSQVKGEDGPSGAVTKQFEGKITYQLIFKDRTGLLSDESAQRMMGDQQHYTIKGDHYRAELNGMLNVTQIYLGGDTLYTQMSAYNGIQWTDSRVNLNELVNFEIVRNADTILGKVCDALVYQTGKGEARYYYNSEIPADPSLFSKHEYGFWKFCVEQTQAIPLRHVLDYKDTYVETIATEITPMEVEKTEFDLPDLPRYKSQ
ncbi:MAG: hypothetical protein AAF804_00830 [Bacteroidota bacterium]